MKYILALLILLGGASGVLIGLFLLIMLLVYISIRIDELRKDYKIIDTIYKIINFIFWSVISGFILLFLYGSYLLILDKI